MENKEYIIVAFTENRIGVLNRITVCYLRRKINIESLKVSESLIKGISMFVISCFTTEQKIRKIRDQINSIIDVIDVQYYTPDQLITQEIALYKISMDYLGGSNRIDAFSQSMGTRMIEFTPEYVVMEKTGTREEIEELHNKLQTDKVLLEFTRSGSVVLHRDSIVEILQEKME